MTKLNTTTRTLLIAVLAVVVAAAAYAALNGNAISPVQNTEVAVEVATANAGGDCTSCPYAGTDQCPAAAKPYVDASKCIGCSKCVRVAPEAFEINEQTGKAQIKPAAPPEAIARGAKACPVDAVVR